MIGVVDYGAGNLRSVTNALTAVGAAFRVCVGVEDLEEVTKISLPGVGHFASAARHLRESGLMEALRVWGRAGRPLLGICLGLQLLFDTSAEGPGVTGLSLLPGCVVPLQARRVPHMGWNQVVNEQCCLGLPPGSKTFYYFAHGFVARPENIDVVEGWVSVEETPIPAIVARDRIWGVQFHPEKSGPAGLELLARFVTC